MARAILVILEEAMASEDEKLRELVSVSFLENLPHAGAEYEQIKKSLPSRLAAEMRAHENGAIARGQIH